MKNYYLNNGWSTCPQKDIDAYLNCLSSVNFDSKISINLESCEINYNLHNTNSDNILSEIYIVGHAYGEPGVGDFFPERLTNYFT